jgi:hypothetical protein
MSSLKRAFPQRKTPDFLKNEYGWGGSYPVIIGAGIDEQHDERLSQFQKVSKRQAAHYASWSQVEKGVSETLSEWTYNLNPKEKENYPEWLEKQEERRAELAEQRKKPRDTL